MKTEAPTPEPTSARSHGAPNGKLRDRVGRFGCLHPEETVRPYFYVPEGLGEDRSTTGTVVAISIKHSAVSTLNNVIGRIRDPGRYTGTGYAPTSGFEEINTLRCLVRGEGSGERGICSHTGGAGTASGRQLIRCRIAQGLRGEGARVGLDQENGNVMMSVDVMKKATNAYCFI